MILVDASAWIQYLRATDSREDELLQQLIPEQRVATTEPVLMELVAGARTDRERDALRATLARAEMLPCEYEDFLAAADLYASARRAGTRVRGLMDCLIAAVAIRTHTPVLSADRDFETLAALSPLQLA